MVKELLSLGIDVNEVVPCTEADRENQILGKAPNDGWSPLVIASKAGRANVVEELLKRGAQVNHIIGGLDRKFEEADKEVSFDLFDEEMEDISLSLSVDEYYAYDGMFIFIFRFLLFVICLI